MEPLEHQDILDIQGQQGQQVHQDLVDIQVIADQVLAVIQDILVQGFQDTLVIAVILGHRLEVQPSV